MARRQLPKVLAAVLVAAVFAVVLERSSADRRRITPLSIVMLGDSITAEGPWAARFPEYPIVNEGHPGFTTEELIAVADRVARSEPRAVLVLTGTNDIRDGRPASWTRDRLGVLLDRLERAENATIVVQTVLPRGDAPDEVQRANEEIRREAERRGHRLVDLHQAFDDGTGALRRRETYDGVHLTRDGYLRWAQVLEPILQDLHPPPPTP